MHLNVDAVVLSAAPSLEADRRLTLFTRERGKLYARATGARRAGARLSAATEPGARARFRLWLPNDAAGGRVTGGSLVAGVPGRGDWERTTIALSLLELTDRLTPLLQPHPEKFDLLTRALAAVGRGAPEAAAAFAVQFGRLAGYGRTGEGRWIDLHARLDAWDFDAPLSVPGEGLAAVEEQVIQWLAPLFSRPLKTWGHRRSLERFRKRVTASKQVP